MTTEEKLKHISDLQNVRDQYLDNIKLINGEHPNNSYHGLTDIGLVPKILYLLGFKTHKEVQYDYSHNIADDELQELVVSFMEKKIAECDEEIESFFCSNDDNNDFPIRGEITMG